VKLLSSLISGPSRNAPAILLPAFLTQFPVSTLTYLDRRSRRIGGTLTVLALLMVFSVSHAQVGQLYSWTGAASDLWSNPNNWTPVGTPANGDSVAFPSGASNLTNTNDLTGLELVDISLNTSGYTLNGNSVVLSGELSSSSVDNVVNLPIDVQGNTVTVGDVTLNGSLSGTGRIKLSASTYTYLSGVHSFSGHISPEDESSAALRLKGAALPAASVSGASFQYLHLYGNGTVGAAGGSVGGLILRPGQDGTDSGTGTLTTGDLNLGFNSGKLVADIDGSVAGTGYDQVAVTGTVTLAMAYSAELYLTMGGSFVPSLGQEYVLIDNDGVDAVVGTFRGKPEGTTITLNGHEFQLSYVGGDGNDVTLITTRVAKTWTGAVDDLWSTPGNWIGGVPTNGDAVAFPAGASNQTNTNDLVGLELVNIGLNAPGYTLNGNGVVLSGELSSSDSDNGVVNLPIDVQANAVTLGNVTLNGMLSGTGPITLLAGTSVYLSGTHSYSGTLSPEAGSSANLRLKGAMLPAASVSGGSVGIHLYGTGTVGTTGSGLDLSPGRDGTDSGPGILNIGDLHSNFPYPSSLVADIDGPSAGTGYDQVGVTGGVVLEFFELVLRMGSGFVPSLGQEYMLIENDGADAVSGSFWDYSEGAVITVNNVHDFQLSYVGGDGNDVTLTSLNGKPASTTSLSSSINPSELGQSVTFTATVTAAGGTPAGTVYFHDGTTILGSDTLSGGAATYTTSDLAVGTHDVTASYMGDNAYGGSGSSVLTQVVHKADTTTTISGHTPNPSDAGEGIVVTYTVAPDNPGAGSPTGDVTVSDGTDDCTGTVAAGTCTLTPTTSGTKTLTATYAGDANFNGSVSTGVSHTVYLGLYDYGDAADPDYPTLLASDGARHTPTGPMLGTLRDNETEGQPTAAGNGDDNDGINDDDGVSFGALTVGRNANVTVTASGGAVLDAWMDFNDNGSWADAGEQVFTSEPLVAGANHLTVAVPVNASGGDTFARFRLSSSGGLSYTGRADDGEVEDYKITLHDDSGESACHGGSHTITAAALTGVRLIQAEATLGTSGDVGVMNNADVTFEAGIQVILDAGFQVQGGGAFAAQIAPVSCGVGDRVR